AMATKVSAASSRDATAWYVLGMAQYRAGASTKAVQALEHADELPEKLAGGSFVLALAHSQLGDKTKAGACYRQGNAWMEQHHPLDDELRRLHAEARTTLGL